MAEIARLPDDCVLEIFRAARFNCDIWPLVCTCRRMKRIWDQFLENYGINRIISVFLYDTENRHYYDMGCGSIMINARNDMIFIKYGNRATPDYYEKILRTHNHERNGYLCYIVKMGKRRSKAEIIEILKLCKIWEEHYMFKFFVGSVLISTNMFDEIIRNRHCPKDNAEEIKKKYGPYLDQNLYICKPDFGISPNFEFCMKGW